MATARNGRPGAATNIGTDERIASAIGGAALVFRAVARPSLGRIILAVGGAALLQRGLSGHCWLYEALGHETPAIARARRAARVERLARARRTAREADEVDRASEDSFPASDPPSWTPVLGSTAKH